MPQQNELRVFISSTFRDLQEEREHLVKKIFPEIRALCRERGITFTEVDLRWGLTEEQAALGTVIRTCLEEVDKCRPYFIGIIGDRYGWVPEFHEILMDPELLQKYPWIEEIALAGGSLTEMEFIHGVFGRSQMDANATFFYRRPATTALPDDPQRLGALIDRARASGQPYREFTNVEQLGEQVRADLIAMIDQYWPQHEAPTPLDLERRAHGAFAASRRRAYIPISRHITELTAWFLSARQPFVISGASGLGKSSLVAYLVESYRRRQPDAFIIEHYVGASQQSGSSLAVMRHVIEEIRDRFAISERLPYTPAEIEQSFPNWLFRLSHLAQQENVPVLIVVDALNQLDDAGQRITWLPRTIPAGIGLVVSTTPGEVSDRLSQRAWSRMNVMPIDEERVRQSIVARYLSEFHKGISVEQLQRVTSNAKASSPLYLRVVAEELRLHGDHGSLDAEILRYTAAADLDEVFQHVLERLEQDYTQPVVRHVLTAVWGSRSGMSEVELLTAADLTRLELSRLLPALDYHLLCKDGLLEFSHDYLRHAVHKRYLSKSQRQVHEELAAYFEQSETTQRSARELIYQYRQLQSWEALASSLSRMDRFVVLWEGETVYEVLSDWRELRERGVDIEESYRRTLTDWASKQGGSHFDGVRRVAEMFDQLSCWPAAATLYAQVIELSQVEGDRKGHGVGHQGLGTIRRRQTRFDEAMDQLMKARAIYEEIGDLLALSTTINDIGIIYYEQGRFDRALEHYGESEIICRQIEDHNGLAGLLHNIGAINLDQGRHVEAMQRFAEALEINRSTGNRRWIANNLNAIGNVHYHRSENDAAMECYQQRLTITEELGDQASVMMAIGSIGNVHTSRGEYDRAMECYQRQLTITEELGDRLNATYAMGYIGMLYNFRGEYGNATEYFQQQLTTSQELGLRHLTAHALGGIGSVAFSCGNYDRALESFEQQMRIATELGDRSGVAYTYGNMGLVHSSRGEHETARTCFEQELSIATELGDRSAIAHAFGSMGTVYASTGDVDCALDYFGRAVHFCREIDEPRSLASWLEEQSRLLLKTIEQEPMPTYLPTFVPEATPQTWRDMAIDAAREDAMECLMISRKLQQQETLIASQILLARIEALGSSGSEAALQDLNQLMGTVTDDMQRAELNYWMWRLRTSDTGEERNQKENCRSEALRLYVALVETVDKREYHTRIKELTSSHGGIDV